MQTPLISVIVPVYKVEKYLPKCVDSILTQTWRNLEIILIDDGSPDGCPAICDEYAKKDNRVRVIHQQNAGVSNARNAGLDSAQGEYVAFVDGDDWCEPDYAESLLNNLLQNQADLSVCGYFQEDLAGKQIKRTKGSGKLLNRSEALRELVCYSGFQGYVWNKLCRREMIEQYQLRFDVNIGICEDLLFYFKLILHSTTVFYDPAPKYHYLQHGSSALQMKFNSTGFNPKWLDEISAVDRLIAITPPEETTVRRRLTAHKVRACATLIRLMANANVHSDLVFDYQKYIRKNLTVLFTEYAGIPFGTKMGVLLTILFPRFSFYLWKKKNAGNARV